MSDDTEEILHHNGPLTRPSVRVTDLIRCSVHQMNNIINGRDDMSFCLFGQHLNPRIEEMFATHQFLLSVLPDHCIVVERIIQLHHMPYLPKLAIVDLADLIEV